MGRQRTSRASAATAAQAGSAQGAAQKVRRERRTRKTRGKIRSRSSTALSMPLLASSVRTGAVFVKSVRTGAAFVTSSKFACGEEHRRGKARGRARVPTVRAAHGTQRASARATARTLIDPEPWAERGGRVGQSGPPEHKHIRGLKCIYGRNQHMSVRDFRTEILVCPSRDFRTQEQATQRGKVARGWSTHIVCVCD